MTLMEKSVTGSKQKDSCVTLVLCVRTPAPAQLQEGEEGDDENKIMIMIVIVMFIMKKSKGVYQNSHVTPVIDAKCCSVVEHVIGWLRRSLAVGPFRWRNSSDRRIWMEGFKGQYWENQ